MTQPPFGPGWTAPPPPPMRYGGPDRPIRGARVAAGIGLAILGHLLTIGLTVLVAFLEARGGLANGDAWFLLVGMASQVLLFVGCIVLGILQIVRGDRGIGVGVLIGWAVGVIVLPVVGFGLCIWAFSQAGY